ncbi:hypothetical protein BAUCODRAFT_36191 [Baudoinia panamericana UAMH 10762]|uniref:Uncharacterized protein n=1 Tax=Baudoinia panamericana (strain UAMH 10762) TaxID=717646 RepID=M2MQH1_BAUPA|nr:uncharacterized protein BAUCODRAFT_36191 [Baudoinia panamericana UAMH 10762]EMC93738.1 hypothetical protein BAUCODRAFT_36191 [Baudoinia panamericana UAMH 10762]
MAGQHEFPALFTIEGSNRHEIILVNPGHDLEELRKTMESLAESSPNCHEWGQKFRSKDVKETVGEIKVKWASEGRDKQLFPKETILTEDNCEPVLRMMAVGVGKDVFDIKLERSEPEKAKK